jgi:formamidopyrimidine-DNA glycosylase
MPELPEVQTIVDDLNKKIKDRVIIDVWTNAPNLIKEPFAKFKKGIVGRKIIRIDRQAKNILIYLDSGKLLLVHLRMTGHLLIGHWGFKKAGKVLRPVNLESGSLAEKANSYLHVIFSLDDGRMLALSDLRKFAKIVFGDIDKVTASEKLGDLGPEAIEVGLEEFGNILRSSKKPIKKLLMDQQEIAGIGNIYSDEILFDAKIHPLALANSLILDRQKQLYHSMRKILEKAIKLRGASVSDFRDTEGEEGFYALQSLVYRHEAEPCPKGCPGKVKRIKIGGRSSYLCPVCQKL